MTHPTDEQIAAEAAATFAMLREACPLSWRIRNIIVKKKHPTVAELVPIPDADGGPCADIVLSHKGLGKDWETKVHTRAAHEWMELALYPLRMQAAPIYCDAVNKTIDEICERASEVMESITEMIFRLKDEKPDVDRA